MIDRRRERELTPVSALAFGAMGTAATAFVVALTAFTVPQPADALPAYAQQTKLACGRCHESAGGGGALTGFGKTFAANGHKVPSKETKPGKTSGGAAAPETPAAAPAAPSVWNLRGTAATFWTTAPGVSNHSATIECFNCGVFVDPR